jgi:CubicO group peptidase (beta-lactamase class C family)
MSGQFDRRRFLQCAGAAIAATPLAACVRTAATSATPTLTPAIADLPWAAPETVGLARDLSARIGQFMQAQIDADRLTGGVTAVARRGRLVHFAAHGSRDPETRSPMPSDGIFRMMSSGKPITGVALLQQIEAGHVGLDDKVSRFIPELSEMRVRIGGEPAATGDRQATVHADREFAIRDLATHTSGLNGFLLDIPAHVPFTLAARVPYARFLTLDYQPGTRWAYSAVTGPDILARVVEITSGLSFDRYLRERIFEPVGMRDTGFNLTDEQRARVVPRYVHDATGWHRAPDDTELAQRLLPRTGDANPKATYFSGSFGLFSAPADYLQFETMLLNGGTIHGRRILRPESVALMASNLVGDLYDGGIAYPGAKSTGFGIQVRTILDPEACACGRARGAFGWGGAYGTTSWTDPANELVAVYFVQQRVLAAEEEFGEVIYKALIP